MTLLTDTVRNIKLLSKVAKKEGTQANIGFNYTINPVTLLVTGNFAFQLHEAEDIEGHAFGYDIIDYVLVPPQIAVSPAEIQATTATDITVTYSGDTPLPPNAVVRAYPANITPLNGNDQSVSNPIGLSTSATFSVNLAAGTYQVLAYVDEGTRAFIPNLSATFTVA